jgi:hypothetical protein
MAVMAVSAERFASLEEFSRAYPDSRPDVAGGWGGPVHRHGDRYLVQVYLGHHEYVSFDVDDLTQAFDDPGWDGTEFGWAYVPREVVRAALRRRLAMIDAP